MRDRAKPIYSTISQKVVDGFGQIDSILVKLRIQIWIRELFNFKSDSSRLRDGAQNDSVVGRGSVAINDHLVEQWSRLPLNTWNLGRDSRTTPKGHGSLRGPWSPIFWWREVGSTCLIPIYLSTHAVQLPGKPHPRLTLSESSRYHRLGSGVTERKLPKPRRTKWTIYGTNGFTISQYAPC